MKVKILNDDIVLYGFGYTKEGDAGIDLRYLGHTAFPLHGEMTAKFKTGIAVEIPEGNFGMIVPRSGLGSRGIILANTVGIIDPNYRGEIIVNLWNRNPAMTRPVVLEPMERIAQLIIMPYTKVKPVFVETLNETDRGATGFGGSGRV